MNFGDAFADNSPASLPGSEPSYQFADRNRWPACHCWANLERVRRSATNMNDIRLFKCGEEFSVFRRDLQGDCC